jgi:hypothetical protein
VPSVVVNAIQSIPIFVLAAIMVLAYSMGNVLFVLTEGVLTVLQVRLFVTPVRKDMLFKGLFVVHAAATASPASQQGQAVATWEDAKSGTRNQLVDMLV